MASSSVLEGLSGFSKNDQIVLSHFGQGPTLQTPHTLVHAAFESTVDSQPDTIAAYYEQAHSLTYRELDNAANHLSNFLIRNGLLPGQRVCLVVSRSLEMLVGILAILKAGCQYVPVDGGVASDKQLSHILRDTEARYVLCLPKFQERVRQFAEADVSITPLDTELYKEFSKERPNTEVTTADGCYAIYTSGSTGTPKGVDVSHKNVTNALLLEPANLGIKKGSKVGSVLSIAFDMGAWEILACLMNGGTLYMRGSDWKATLREVSTRYSSQQDAR
jgi:non-ribosomal peptide synthetase component F